MCFRSFLVSVMAWLVSHYFVSVICLFDYYSFQFIVYFMYCTCLFISGCWVGCLLLWSLWCDVISKFIVLILYVVSDVSIYLLLCVTDCDILLLCNWFLHWCDDSLVLAYENANETANENANENDIEYTVDRLLL